MATKKKGAATVAPPSTALAKSVSIGTTEFRIGTLEVKSAALKREYALSCKAITKAAVAVQGAYYDIAKSFARVQDGELYKPDFTSMTEYVAKGFGMEEAKAASTISIFVKAGREYLLADKAVEVAQVNVETVLADPDKTDADREEAAKALAKAEEVRNIHATMTPARIAEMRNVSAVQAIADGKIDGTETLRQLREVNKSLAPVKAKARAEKRVQVVLYDSSMSIYGNPIITDNNSLDAVKSAAFSIICKVTDTALYDDFLPLAEVKLDLTYEGDNDTTQVHAVHIHAKDETGKDKTQVVKSANYLWVAITVYHKSIGAIETYYACAATLKGTKATAKGKGKASK